MSSCPPSKSVGIGLRSKHYSNFLNSDTPLVPWCEAISENYMFTEGRPITILEKIRETYPIALHGVSMSIGSSRKDHGSYLEALSRLINRVDPWIVTDHFCWSGLGGINSFDLLPMPLSSKLIPEISDNIDRVQVKLQRKIYFENISAYVKFKIDDISEIEFINQLIIKTGCGLLLDVNNVYVNSKNFGLDPKKYIDQIDPKSIGEIHLAGHSQVDDFLFDTHDGPVCDDVINLYQYTLNKLGSFPTLIEWDESIPEFERLLNEKEKIESMLI